MKYLASLILVNLYLNTFPGINKTILIDGPNDIHQIIATASLIDDNTKETKFENTVIQVNEDKSTFLYCSKETRIAGNLTLQGGENRCWKGNAELVWTINVPSKTQYDVFLIADVPEESKNAVMILDIQTGKFKFNLEPTFGPWEKGRNFQRIKVLSKVTLKKGSQEIKLKNMGSANENRLMDIRSIELIPVSAYQSIEKEKNQAIASRASTEWLTKAGYGLMFHWTSQSVNSDGSHKPYSEAVSNFDVAKFANMVEETGAGYVIFTIGHAEAYCPAPLKSWEKHHPGMTTKRDLIAEISDQLKTKNIRMICYLPTHVVAKYKKVNSAEFMNINTEVLQEMGERYKDKIAGYWFDGWYQCFEEYPNVSFKAFFEATKVGNKDRIIALNSWIYPPVTPWQEYWAGEVASPVVPPEKGFMKNGPAPDLRYHALLIMEPYWVQEKAGMPDPRFTPSGLSQYIQNCMDNGGAVTINMGIYQDGHVGDKALQVMKEVKTLIRTVK